MTGGTPPARTDDLDLDVARWLVTDGRSLVDEATARLDAGQDELAVATGLRALAPDGPSARACADAAVARRLARATWPEADRLLFTRAALEQASDPRVAAHRAARHARHGALTADLGCGIGSDALALAAAGNRVLAVDRSRTRAVLCAHNAAVIGADVAVVVGDALHPPVAVGATIHADPGRRPGGRRARWLRDHEPPVGALAAAIRRHVGAGIVLSPAVPLDDPDLPDGELEFAQVGRRLVEATCWLGGLRTDGAIATATLLDEDGGIVATRTRRAGAPEVPVGEVGRWLLDPAPALVRARLHHDHGLDVGARRVARDRALLSTDEEPDRSPWHTAWLVDAVVNGRPRAVADALRGMEALPLSIEVHGDRRPVQEWWKALKGQPRGPIGRRVHIIAGDGRVRAVLARTWPTEDA